MPQLRLTCFPLMLLATAAQADCWQLPSEDGGLRFTATQAGAPIQGEFRHYRGTLMLPTVPGDSGVMSVEVETASVDTQLPELDELLRGPLFFASNQWPLASFQSTRLELLEPGHYRASGPLRIRGVEHNVQADFTIAAGRLTAQAEIRRLDFDLGQEEWRNTEWVGNPVILDADTPLQPATTDDCRKLEAMDQPPAG